MDSFVSIVAAGARRLAALLMLAAASAQLGAAEAEPAPLPGVATYSLSFDAGRDAEADFAAALQAAAARRHRVLVMVGGDWCVWCFLLDRHLREDPEAARLMYTGFELLRVYYNDDNTNDALLARFPGFTMFPHFFVVDTDARVLASVPADALIRDARYDTALIRQFVQQWQP